MTSSRVVRSRQTEEAVAEWFRQHGWAGAERAPASLPGVDVRGMPGLAVEVKARRDLSLPSWLKQAGSRDGLPMVVHRPDGFGLTKVGLWPVTFRLRDITPVLYHWDLCHCIGACDGHAEL